MSDEIRHLPTRCHLCDSEAVAVFYFSRGCYCDPATVQPLCGHHAFRSMPTANGTKELIKDLTADGGFAAAYEARTPLLREVPA